MATKNQIASTIWIMKTIQILWDKSHKQLRLEYVWRERVGINGIACRSLCKGSAFFYAGYKRAFDLTTGSIIGRWKGSKRPLVAPLTAKGNKDSRSIYHVVICSFTHRIGKKRFRLKMNKREKLTWTNGIEQNYFENLLVWLHLFTIWQYEWMLLIS